MAVKLVFGIALGVTGFVMLFVQDWRIATGVFFVSGATTWNAATANEHTPRTGPTQSWDDQ